MKKLSKLKLREYHEMSDGEMKHVVGGSGGSNSKNCSYTCGGKTESITCYGTCESLTNGVKCIENGKQTGKIECLTSGSY